MAVTAGTGWALSISHQHCNTSPGSTELGGKSQQPSTTTRFALRIPPRTLLRSSQDHPRILLLKFDTESRGSLVTWLLSSRSPPAQRMADKAAALALRCTCGGNAPTSAWVSSPRMQHSRFITTRGRADTDSHSESCQHDLSAS